MVSLEAILSSAAAASPSKTVALPIPEAQVATLLETFSRYSAPCPFKPGDLVMPRTGFGYTDEGRPHVVLEVSNPPIRPFGVSDRLTPASNLYGLKLDIRVACFRSNGEVDAFWQESWRHEPYEARP